MSLDLTIGTRQVALDPDEEQIGAEAAASAPLWLIDLLAVAMTACGVVLSSVLAVLLFLH